MPPLWRRRPLVSVALLLLVAVGLLARRTDVHVASGNDYGTYHGKVFEVVRVVDGDTIDLGFPDGKQRYTRVRFWGVDTPEVAGSGRAPMHYGPEASAFTKAELEHRRVEVLLLERKFRDKYGRLLAYLRLPDAETTFNERLVATGHAYADWRFDHPHKERFLAAERSARDSGAGLWRDVRQDQFPRWRQRSERARSPTTRPGRTCRRFGA